MKCTTIPSAIVFALFASAIVAFAPHQTASLKKTVTTSLRMGLLPEAPTPTRATQACPPGSMNCVRTTWTAPRDVVTPKQAAEQLETAFTEYPRSGQDGIDRGGWKIARGSFAEAAVADDDEKGVVRLEYTSGRSFLTFLLNGGRGFVDDVLVEISKDKSDDDDRRVVAELRSSSRLGKSDLGVNQKRLRFLADKMRQRGWEAPPPTYPSSK